MKVGFIGFGRMGSVIAAGGLKEKKFNRRDMWAYAPSAASRRKIRSMGVRSLSSAAEVVQQSQFVWLCVKPQKMSEALNAVRAAGSLSGKRFVSIAAGVGLERLERELGRVAVLRVMPNTPSLLGAGMAAVSRGRYASAQDERQVQNILSSLGEVVGVKEKHMHAVTAVSGSGPAYIFNMAEAMIKAARKLGLDQKLAEKLVRQTIFGAGKMLQGSKTPAGELRKQVTSPGGTTAAALAEFERRGFDGIVAAALKKAVQRSKELSRIK